MSFWQATGNEIGFRIDKAGIVFDIRTGDETSVAGKTYAEERELSKTSVACHTHPGETEIMPFSVSAQDILACAFRGREIIVGRDNYAVLTAKNILPVEEIAKIDRAAWDEAQLDSEGNPYWVWKSIIREKLEFTAEFREGSPC